jgi:3-oxoacyl-[acyl-carrier-protein] synthase-3
VIPARILATASRLPGSPRPTAALAAALPGRDPADIERKTGIRARHWVAPGERATDLGAAVARDALAQAGLAPDALRRVIFVTSTGGDALIPANANAVCEALGLDGSCDGFDVNNACMGFLSAFDLACRSVATGLGPCAVIVVETLSPFLSPDDPRPYLVLADAAAAVIVGEGRPGEGVVATHLANRGALRGSVTLAHPGLSPPPARIAFSASHDELTQLANQALQASAAQVLREAGVTLDDVAWVAPHQPNGRMLDKIAAHLGVAPEKIVPVVAEVGSVGAASIPLSLDRLFRTRDVRPGDHILLVGVGAGMAYGATLFRVAP